MTDVIMPPFPPSSTEEQASAVEDQASVVEDQASVVEEQASVVEEQASVEEEPFIPGNFDYIQDSWTRKYVQDAYQVISRNEWWGKFKKALEIRGVSVFTGFTFTDDPLYKIIMNGIASTPIGGGHSGCSMGWCMREMQQIALFGEREYKKQYIIQQNRR
jgi:nucleoid-associated protein YgaU